MSKALIVYASKRGETFKLAEMIAEELRALKVEVTLAEVSDIQSELDLFEYDAYVFGSPTYFGEMTDSMKDLLHLAEIAELADKAGGAFGAYGWSGEAPRRMHGVMEHVFHMDMTREPLQISSSTAKIALKVVKSFCQEITTKITEED